MRSPPATLLQPPLAANVTPPVPLPPVVLAVKDEPYGADAGATTVSVPCVPAVMVTFSVAVVLPLKLFVAVKVTLDCPIAVGVPEISPVAVSIDRPDGRPIAS